MNHSQATRRPFQLKSFGSAQIGRLRVGIGIWLLVLTAALYELGVGGLWELSLVATAALHFVLARRSFRIARNDRDRGTTFE